MEKGYSSHGVFASIHTILEEEQERENEYTVHEITKYLEHNDAKNIQAIWVTRDPYQCFKYYVLPAQYFYYTDETIQSIYPRWKSLVNEVDLTELSLVCEDLQGGYLYCTERRM